MSVRTPLKKGFLNSKSSSDRKQRTKEDSSGKSAPDKQDSPALPDQFSKGMSAVEMRRAGKEASDSGHAVDAADLYFAACVHQLSEGALPGTAIAALSDALLRANCVSDAQRVASSAGDSDECGLVARQSAKSIKEAMQLVNRLAKSPEASPVQGLLYLMRSGIEDANIWKSFSEYAEPFFKQMGDMLQENGALVKGGMMSSTLKGIRYDMHDVILFPDETRQGGLNMSVQQNQTYFKACEEAGRLLGLQGGCNKLWSCTNVPFSDCAEACSIPWGCLRQGDMLHAGGSAPPTLKLAPEADSWPEPRCPKGLLTGSIARVELDAALQATRRQHAVIVGGAHVLAAAEEKWSLDYLQDSIPSGTSEASSFSVYRATSLNRAFRYADEASSSSAYDIEGEQQADRVYMSFSEFAQKKRSSAEGDGDGWAYYLWGVALRHTHTGGYEGYNFGQAVDQDLLEGPHWDIFDQIRKAGGWGTLKQAQIFIGCRNALTPCHFDLVHNAYVQVRGWKRFILLDPVYGECLYPYPGKHPMDRCARVDLESPNYARFPRFRHARAVEAVLGPGDMLIIPAGWWHHVQTLTEDSVSVSFWFEDDACQRASASANTCGPLSSLDRVLLAREAEQLLSGMLGPHRVRNALGHLRGMLGAEAPKPDPEEILPCFFILWQLVRTLGPGSARRFVRALADDARFALLRLKKTS